MKRREVVRLTVVWSLLLATVVMLLVVLWPAESADQDTQDTQEARADGGFMGGRCEVPCLAKA